MKKIELSQGQFAIVDDEDYPYLSRFKWHSQDNKAGSWNAATTMHLKNDRYVVIPMWLFILESKNRLKIHHLNRNTLDYRKENLRLVTPSEANIAQPKSPKGNGSKLPTSKYKGVCYRQSQPLSAAYEATIQKDGIAYRKRFASEREAALWYNKKAFELYGDIAYQNKLD